MQRPNSKAVSDGSDIIMDSAQNLLGHINTIGANSTGIGAIGANSTGIGANALTYTPTTSTISFAGPISVTINGHVIRASSNAGAIILDGQEIHTGHIITYGRHHCELTAVPTAAETLTGAIITISSTSPATPSARIARAESTTQKIRWSYGNCEDPSQLTKHHDFDPGADFGIVIGQTGPLSDFEDEGGEF